MKIKSIPMKNVKGTTEDQSLTGKDIFIGPNGSGKSTRIQSIEQAILGYVTGNGKTNQETFKLSTGDEMTTGLSLDGFSFTRTLKRTVKLKADGTKDVKNPESLSVSPSKGEKTATEMKSRIAQEIGNFPVAFDFSEFMNKSDAKRREFIYSLSPMQEGSWNRERVQNTLIDNLLTIGLKTTSPDLYDATKDMVNQALEQWPESYDLTSGLQAMSAWVTQQQVIWNAKSKDAQGAVRELAEMKNKLTETDRDIAANKEELKKLRDERTDINGQIQSGKELKRQWDQKKERMEAMNLEIKSITDALAKPIEDDSKAKIDELQAQIKEMDITEQSKAFQTEINTLQEQRKSKQTEREGLQSSVNKIESEIATIDNVSKAINEKKVNVCVIHHQIKCDKDFSKFMGHVDDRKPELEAKLKEVNDKRQSLADEIAALEKKEKEISSQKDKLYEDLTQQNQSNKSLQTQIDGIKKANQAKEQQRRDDEASLRLKQAELDRLEQEKMPAFAPLDVLEKQYESLKVQIENLDQTVEEQEKSRITLSNMQTSMISGSKSTYYHTACKNLSNEIGYKGIQGELVKSILGPIEDSINDNLALMGIKWPCFFSTESDTGKESFQFGWVKRGKETNFDVLSTGEQLMFLSAFLVTLLERANPPLKVLAIDNVENLWSDNFKNFLSGLNTLSHKVDNIIIAGAVQTLVKQSELPDGLSQNMKEKFVTIEELEDTGWKVWDLTTVAEESKEAVTSA